jgi:putative exporter of polyketide antibiotics
MKYIKLSITTFFLFISFWLTTLIFGKQFSVNNLEYAIDNHTENTLMILIISTVLSAIGIFLLGLLALFIHYVFVKLTFHNEIRKDAFLLLKYRRNKQNKLKTK